LLPIAVVSVLQGLERSRVGSENVHDRLVRSARDAAGHHRASVPIDP